MGWRRGVLIGGAVVLASAAALMAAHEVPTGVTDEDRIYGAKILANADYEPEALMTRPAGFEAEIETVLAVQNAVLMATEVEEPLPRARSREPRDLWEERRGYCFDRSRVIEKILASAGMEVRHIAAYRTGKISALKALLTPGADPGASHALSEVKTEKGWMLIDSNGRWIGLDAEGELWSANRMDSHEGPFPEWSEMSAEPPHPLLTNPHVAVIGLFSRHGGFFAPYNPVPDVNYRQLVQNLI